MDFDTLRATYPHLAFAVYAFTPGGPVTLECLTTEGATFKFTGPTLADAIAEGFTEEPVQGTPVDPAASVFD